MNAIQLYEKKSLAAIRPTDCVGGIVLCEIDDKPTTYKVIGTQIARMFHLLGEQPTDQKIDAYLEFFTEKFQFEQPETIILFLRKAGNGDFGKSYGKIDTGTLSEWWAKFYNETIAPALEDYHRHYTERHERISSSDGIGNILKRLGNNGRNKKK
jgi:hypothetical protein